MNQRIGDLQKGAASSSIIDTDGAVKGLAFNNIIIMRRADSAGTSARTKEEMKARATTGSGSCNGNEAIENEAEDGYTDRKSDISSSPGLIAVFDDSARARLVCGVRL